ncbi:hypothetical protein, partial [Aeromonas hydrophila]|uniref:hypothetical protein n=1 Tax=Aeromonas hydrophila TaxID=644 RepID=UPI00214EC26B
MRKIALIATLVMSHALFLAGGAYMAKQQTMDWFVSETEAANAEVMLGHYGIYKDIGVEIGSGRVERAKCNADLGASTMFD